MALLVDRGQRGSMPRWKVAEEKQLREEDASKKGSTKVYMRGRVLDGTVIFPLCLFLTVAFGGLSVTQGRNRFCNFKRVSGETKPRKTY